MKSILITIVCITFSLLINAQTADSVKTTENNKLKENEIEKEVFLILDKAPQFPGGENAMMKFLGENMKYPKVAREAGIQGTVYLSFVVGADGSISTVQVTNGIGGGCDEEAVRVVQSMPKWKPGIQRGKPVPVNYTLPICFILHDSPKTEKNKSKQ